ncbi:MAG: glycosyltransferase family 2 protein [Paludibacteraceae bacterium]|nr:glycosyltransferase family 2 protein [Paludibacteraceae bacterium]
MLNVSIVLYHPDVVRVNDLCTELLSARCVRRIYLVDNSPISYQESLLSSSKITYWHRADNPGYGSAHNMAIRESVYYNTPFHLVINDDVRIAAADLDLLHDFIASQPQVGSLMPRVVYPDGRLQYLCKLLPSPLDLISRRFLSKGLFAKRNARFELRHSGYDFPMNVPYLSGCFMLLRTQAVLQARLFDERYFMYPEDIDLTRTIHRDYLTLYYPAVTVVHDHRQASYHTMHMTKVHIVNMCRYFNKWGWIFDKERREFNRRILEDIRNHQSK